VIQAAVDAGDIKIVAEAYTDGWLPANAQRNMEQILTAQDNKVDAVVASNDGTAGGVVAALTAQGMEGIPVSGQDGDHAARCKCTDMDIPSWHRNDSGVPCSCSCDQRQPDSRCRRWLDCTRQTVPRRFKRPSSL